MKKILSLVMLMLVSISCQGGPFFKQAAAGQGAIVALDIDMRWIQINQKKYPLAEDLQVYSKDNSIYGDGALKIGQNVDYWFDDSGKVEIIKIWSGFKKEYENM